MDESQPIAPKIPDLPDALIAPVLIPDLPEFGNYPFYQENPGMTDPVVIEKSLQWLENPRFIGSLIVRNGPQESAELGDKFVGATFTEKGPIINVVLDPASSINSFVAGVEILKHRFGMVNIGKGARVVIDYSSPNLAKPLHVGHLGSTLVGAELSRFYTSTGHEVIADNHVGDYGPAFTKIAQFILNNQIDPESLNITDLLELYLSSRENRVESDNTMSVLEYENIMRIIHEITSTENGKIYDALGAKFNYEIGEALYADYAKELVELLIQKGIAQKTDGETVLVDLPGFGKRVLVNKEGTPLYVTRDIACILARAKWFSPEEIVYVMGINDKEVIGIAKLLAEKIGDDINIPRISYRGVGTIRDKEGEKLSTRSGNFTSLEELINRAHKAVSEKVKERDIPAPIIRDITRAAMVYWGVKNPRESDVTFDIEEAIKTDGNTGPYLQYQLVRINSILNNVECNEQGTFDVSNLEQDEMEIMSRMSMLSNAIPGYLITSVQKGEPYILAKATMLLAREFSRYYSRFKVLDESNLSRQQSRVIFLKSLQTTFYNLYKILGIPPVERM